MTVDDDRWYAYAAGRSMNHLRNVRHAVDHMSHVCGANDVECGRSTIKLLIYLGDWEPDNPENCRLCARLVAEADV